MHFGVGNKEFFLNPLENSFLDVIVIVGKVSSNFEILRLKIIEFFHASPAEEEVILLIFVLLLVRMINLAESVSSSDVMIVAVHFGIYLVFHRSLLVKRDILEIDLIVDWIDLVHNFDFFIFQTVVQILLWVCDVVFWLVENLLLFRVRLRMRLFFLHLSKNYKSYTTNNF